MSGTRKCEYRAVGTGGGHRRRGAASVAGAHDTRSVGLLAGGRRIRCCQRLAAKTPGTRLAFGRRTAYISYYYYYYCYHRYLCPRRPVARLTDRPQFFSPSHQSHQNVRFLDAYFIFLPNDGHLSAPRLPARTSHPLKRTE